MAALTTPAAAQLTQRPERPYRGLFGGGAAPGGGQSVNVRGSIGGGYDDNLLLDQPGRGRSSSAITRPVAGRLGTASGSIAYAANVGQFSFGANVGSFLRYYPGQTTEYLDGHSAGLSLRAPLGRRTAFGVSQSAQYMPFTFSTLFPFQEDPALAPFETPPMDLVTTADTEFLSYGTATFVQHQFSRRVTGNANYAYSGRDSSLYNEPFTRHNGGGGLSFALSQGLSLNLGYYRMEGRYSSDRRMSQDTVNLGVNYQRALSFSRRTTLGFSSGTTTVSDGNRTRFRALGSATLNHEVGRTWLATASYTRGVRFLETLLEPVFQDSAMAGFGGLVNRRVQVQTAVQASLGQIGLANRNGFNSYVGTAGATIAISQNMNFGLSYSYFHYRFSGNTVLPPGVPPEVNRQSVRASINVWAPLLNTARRANAAR
jgi:opacity protein-like surface antigen